jgi:hypothetical protein
MQTIGDMQGLLVPVGTTNELSAKIGSLTTKNSLVKFVKSSFVIKNNNIPTQYKKRVCTTLHYKVPYQK